MARRLEHLGDVLEYRGEQFARVKAYRWTILAIVSLGQSMAALVGLCVLSLSPFIQAEFGISRAQVGVLLSALYVGALLSSLPAGWLTDAIGSRAMLVGSQVLIGAGVLLVSGAGGFAHALAVMPVVGMGYGGINPMSSKAVMGWFPGYLRGTAMGIKQTGFALGNALGALTLPSLALAAGWRTAMALAAAAMLASAAVGGWLFREPPTAVRRARGAASPRALYADLVRNRDLMLLVGTGAILSGVQLVISGYLVLFLVEAVKLPVVLAGAILSLVQISGVVGRVSWGAASDHLTGGRRRPVLVGLATVSALATAIGGLLGEWTPLSLVLGWAVVLGCTAVGWNGVYATLIGELAGGGSVAGATALSTAANFLGVVVGPPLFGLGVDLLGSYSLAWPLLAAVGLANAAALLLVREKR